MSGPRDPSGRQPGPHGHPGPYEYPQQGPYGQPGQYGQYDQPVQHGQYAQPGQYGFPQPVPPPMARPTTVVSGVLAFATAALVGLVSSVVTLLNLEAYVDQALADVGFSRAQFESTGFAEMLSTTTVTLTAVFALLGVALYATMTWFAWQGHNWARIVLWVFGGLGLFGVFSAVTAPLVVVTVLGVLQVLLLIAAIVLLALKPSHDWFRTRGLRRRARLTD